MLIWKKHVTISGVFIKLLMLTCVLSAS